MATQQQQQQPQRVPIDQLHPQQLVMVKKQAEEDILILTQSLNQLRMAIGKYDESRKIIKDVKQPENQNKEMLLPITSSLYITGTLEDNENVLIDYGTGYFVERTMDQADGYCERKIKFLKDNLDKISNILNQKKDLLEKVSYEIQIKMQQQIAAQQAAAAQQQQSQKK